MTKFFHILFLIYFQFVRSESDLFSEFIKPDSKITKTLDQKVKNFYTEIDERILDNDISIISNVEDSNSSSEIPIIYISRVRIIYK